MKIGIYYNDRVEEEVAEHLAGCVRKQGAECLLFQDADAICGIDRLVVLGGDGTVLHAAKRVSVLNIPLVAVNFGRIGFLTEFEREDAEDAVKLALSEESPKLVRAMLEVELNGVKTACLNEIALLREISPARPNRVEKIAVRIDGSEAGDFTADGLIVATPTGSTAYSLSAGGCIMTPDCASFLLTPVCAFSLKSRPVACPDSSTLTVSVATGDTLLAYGDGVFLGKVEAGDGIIVKKSERKAVFLTRDSREFFHRLTQKIN